jgi:hypothetical protein
MVAAVPNTAAIMRVLNDEGRAKLAQRSLDSYNELNILKCFFSFGWLVCKESVGRHGQIF